MTLFRFDLVELTALKLRVEDTNSLIVFQFEDQGVLGGTGPTQDPYLNQVSFAKGGAELGPLIYKLAKLDHMHVDGNLGTAKMQSSGLRRFK